MFQFVFKFFISLRFKRLPESSILFSAPFLHHGIYGKDSMKNTLGTE